MLVKWLSNCHLLSARCVRTFQNKNLLEIFPFLSSNCRNTGNVRTGTQIVNPCIVSVCLMRSRVSIFLTRIQNSGQGNFEESSPKIVIFLNSIMIAEICSWIQARKLFFNFSKTVKHVYMSWMKSTISFILKLIFMYLTPEVYPKLNDLR